jgi:hypothetical protein
MSSAVSYIILAFKALVEKDMANKIRTAEANLQYFTRNWAKMPILLGDWVTGVFSVPLVLISPGFWIYLVTMWKGRSPDISFSLNLHGIVNPAAAMTPGAIQFDLLDLADLASIEWTNRSAVKAQLGLSVDLIKEVEILISADLRANPCLDVSTDVIVPEPDSVWDWLDDPSTKTPLWNELVGKHLHKIAVGKAV